MLSMFSSTSSPRLLTVWRVSAVMVQVCGAQIHLPMPGVCNWQSQQQSLVTDSCLKYIQALTSSLQAEAKDIVAAVREIDTVTSTVQDVCDNIDTHHSTWFLTISEMLSQVGVEPSVPRRCGRQIHRSNLPADTPIEYYKRTISIPVVDHLLSELRSQFGDHQRRAMLGLSIVPSLFVSLGSADHACRVKELADLYGGDLPSPECFKSELHSWHIKWQQQQRDYGESSLPTTLTLTLKHVSSMFPNITAHIKILCTLSVTQLLCREVL